MPDRICSIDGCGRPTRARGWCAKHYRRWYKHGDPNFTCYVVGGTLEDRFWSHVDRRSATECWPWTGSLDGGGYGQFRLNKSTLAKAHRFAYELLVGPIPDGLELDHVWDLGCFNRHCVNPGHLDPVTSRVNVLRGNSIAAMNARKTHCEHGHEFSPGNTYVDKSRGWRSCRTCARDRRRANRQAGRR